MQSVTHTRQCGGPVRRGANERRRKFQLNVASQPRQQAESTLHTRSPGLSLGSSGEIAVSVDAAKEEVDAASYTRHVVDRWQDGATVGLPATEHEDQRAATELERAKRAIAGLERQNAALRHQVDGLTDLLASAVESGAQHEQQTVGALLLGARPPASSPSPSPSPATTSSSASMAAASGANGAAGSANGAAAPSQQQQQQGSEGGPAPPLREQAPAIQQCVLQHAGALCCTSTMLSQEEDSRRVMVTMQTTLRCANDSVVAGSFSMEELHGLAAQALLASAGDLCRSATERLQSRSLAGPRCEAHEDLTAALARGRVAEVLRVIPSAFGHESFEVAVEDGVTGRRVRALFKPRVPGDSDGWHRASVEYVAYRLNMMLGMDLVPPAAYRTGGVQLPGHGSYDEGALLYFSHNAVQLKEVPLEAWGVPQDVLLSDTRILDVLLHNSDRHHGHFLFGEHWAHGGWQGGEWRGEPRPVLIDHAAGFREGAFVSMQHENAFSTGAVRCVSASTYLRLRFLDAAAITSAFGAFLSERELRDMLHRRNHVLRYLDKLVETQGYGCTVLSLACQATAQGSGGGGAGGSAPALHLRSERQRPQHQAEQQQGEGEEPVQQQQQQP